MACGNDGNLLQHSIEMELAAGLRKIKRASLHVALTHGMAPWEPCEKKKKSGQEAWHQLRDALRSSEQQPTQEELAVIRAYRSTQANFSRYPNSVALLTALVEPTVKRRGGLNYGVHGGVTERDATKATMLQNFVGDRAIVVAAESWRQGDHVHECLRAPERLEVPWLFSMDPMKYRDATANGRDDDKIYSDDADRIQAALAEYLLHDVPGAASIFVFSMQPREQLQFEEWASDLAGALDVVLRVVSTTHLGGNRNMAGVLSRQMDRLDTRLVRVAERFGFRLHTDDAEENGVVVG